MPEQELSPREKLRQARLEQLNKMQQQSVGRVRVVPRDEHIRAILAHPTGWLAFPASGSVEWPDDAFTRRRIEDGDVTVEGGAQSGEPSATGEATTHQSRGSAEAQG